MEANNQIILKDRQRKKRGLTFSGHKEMGIKLFQMQEQLNDILTTLICVYPLKDPVHKYTAAIFNNLLELRSRLDYHVFREYRGKETNELARCYYGGLGNGD